MPEKSTKKLLSAGLEPTANEHPVISCFPMRNTTFFLRLPSSQEGRHAHLLTQQGQTQQGQTLTVSPVTQPPQTHDARHTKRHILRAGNLQETIIHEPYRRATHDESTRSQTHSRKTHSREHTPDNARQGRICEDATRDQPPTTRIQQRHDRNARRETRYAEQRVRVSSRDHGTGSKTQPSGS